MMGGSEGKIVYLHHSSAESKYYTLRCVLRTKWSFHSVLGIKSVFVVCCTQIHTFTMSLIQISLEILIVGKESGITGDGKVLLT